MTNLVEKCYGKISLNNQAHKLGVQLGEISGFKNLVEKLVDNLLTKLSVQLIEHLFRKFLAKIGMTKLLE